MTDLHDAQIRSALMAERIRQRTDIALRELISEYEDDLVFCPLDKFMISEQAWQYIKASGNNPKFAFAHPKLLRAFPSASQYYRGIALLPLKRVAKIAGSVASWESGDRKTSIGHQKSEKVAQLYNAVISSIIEGTSNWTLENGYRNIIATLGIGLDGTFRNIIGQDAEELIKTRILNWLDSQQLICARNSDSTEFSLPLGYSMHYGAEPDILFQRNQDGIDRSVATIEVKGGKDPAGALERLGAMQKSFENTPPNCVNILIAGVVTDEMKARLVGLGVEKVFLLDSLAHDGESWIDFLNEVFHYTIRITKETIT